jgi:heterodisulfide reductase subunit B
MTLVEPRGWVCCGSSAAHRADPEAALRLPMENLALIERSGFQEVTMPCAACYSRHKVVQNEIAQHPERKADLDESIGYTYQDSVRVTTLIEAIHEHVGVEAIADHVAKPLEGLRVVCYYGCLLTRPPEVTGATHPENPTDMDELMAALGAEVVDWSYKTSCCGAAHSLTRTDIVLSLSGNLIEQAQAVGADVIAVACPLCHTNLDARQFQMALDSPTPVLYFTQLMALALGLPEKEAALHKNLVDPRPQLRAREILPV